MKRHTFVLAVVAVSLLALAPAAHADAVPFDLHYELGEQSFEAGVTHAVDTGLIGLCDREPFCTGIRLTASTSNVTAETDSGTLTLRGYVCVRDTTLECSANGVPFTGVRLTDFFVDGPGGTADALPVDTQLCVWFGSSPETPDLCFPGTALFGGDIDWDGAVVAPVGFPSDLGLSF